MSGGKWQAGVRHSSQNEAVLTRSQEGQLVVTSLKVRITVTNCALTTTHSNVK